MCREYSVFVDTVSNSNIAWPALEYVGGLGEILRQQIIKYCNIYLFFIHDLSLLIIIFSYNLYLEIYRILLTYF